MILKSAVRSLVFVSSLWAVQDATAQSAPLPQPSLPNEAPRPLAPDFTDPPAELLAALAGRYEQGGGFTGNSLELHEDGRFGWTDWGCTHSHLYTGRVKSDGGDLLLVSDALNDQRAEGGPQTSNKAFGPFVPVPWGERRYLVERIRLGDFCNAFNAGTEPACRGFGLAFLLREGDRERAIEGLPEVPAAWRNELLHPGVWGHITSTESGGKAVVDLGSGGGIRAGMGLGLHFELNSDWAVPQRSNWYFSTRLVVLEVGPDSCLVSRAHGDAPLRLGQLVTGGIAAEPPLPPATWRPAADDVRLSFDPLPPAAGSSPGELERWTEQIEASFSPGIPITPRLSPELMDALTPAFFNAVRGMNMADETDIRRASTILDVWHGYQSQCSPPRQIALHFDGDPGWDPERGALDRIWQVETFVMWWREMSADPKRLADFQRGESP